MCNMKILLVPILGFSALVWTALEQGLLAHSTVITIRGCSLSPRHVTEMRCIEYLLSHEVIGIIYMWNIYIYIYTSDDIYIHIYIYKIHRWSIQTYILYVYICVYISVISICLIPICIIIGINLFTCIYIYHCRYLYDYTYMHTHTHICMCVISMALCKCFLVSNPTHFYFGDMPVKDILYWKLEREGKLKDCFSDFPFKNYNFQTYEGFDTVKTSV